VLPLDRSSTARPVRAIEHIDAGMMDDALAYARGAWGAFDASNRGMVHGDPHLGNVLWHEGEVTALLDLEWARRSWIEWIWRSCCRSSRHRGCSSPRSTNTSRAPSTTRTRRRGWPTPPGVVRAPRLLERLRVLLLSRHIGLYADEPPRRPRDRSDPRTAGTTSRRRSTVPSPTCEWLRTRAAGAVKRLQLVVGGGDRDQRVDEHRQLPARHREVDLFVAETGVDAVADAGKLAWPRPLAITSG